MRLIKEAEEKILYALAELQYLTVSQVQRLSGQAKRTVSRHFTALANSPKPLIKGVHYTDIQFGRRESIYYLSSRGIKELEAQGLDRSQIKAPIGDVGHWRSTYYHKVRTIDFFVSLRIWANNAGHEIEYLTYDFQQASGTNRNNKGGQTLSDNKVEIEKDGIGYIVPDGIFLLNREGMKPIFGLFEQHNGKDTAKLMRQIEGHCVAISQGIPSIRNNVTYEGKLIANRVFIAFEREACMRATMYRMMRDERLEPLIKFFHFKLSSDILTTNFDENWVYANGELVEF